MKFILVVFLVIIQTGCMINHVVMVGDERVIIREIKGQGKTYVHVHQNEKTALKAAKKIMYHEGSGLITLAHSGGRTIVFHLHKQRYEFDPNRIYTNKGIQKTLKQYSHFNQEAYYEVKKLANQIKALLPAGKIVAIHNNVSYSLKDYLPGHELAHDAQAYYLNPKNYYRNFYLTTQKHDYKRLKNKGFNGVLQKNSASDDGSLSIYLARREYINVEAGYDQLTAQIKMLLHA